MNRIIHLFKSNIDLNIALVLAVVTSFGEEVTINTVVSSLNSRILLLLLCLMLVIGGFKVLGLLDYLFRKSCVFVSDTRSLSRLFIGINFVLSALITNDVSLIIFVPLSIKALLSVNRRDLIIKVVSLETIAANMGSMLTPVGNPQNLFIYSYYHYDLVEFLKITAPIYILCGVILFAFTHFIDKTRLEFNADDDRRVPFFRSIAFIMLFILCILCVLRVIDVYILSVIVLTSVFIINRQLFLQADYKLLLLFIFLFVFVGNICTFDLISSMAHQFVQGYEFFVSFCLSQIISNVPATLMLCGFALNPDDVLRGVDVGGLGTIVASMASLISFKAYMKLDGERPLYYLKKFTKYNLQFLIFLIPLHIVFPTVF